MNYTITDYEFHALDAVRGQLGLVAGLLTAKGADANLYDASDLYDFLAAQVDSIKSLLKTVDERYDLARDENNSLSWIDWYNMLQVVSGRRAMRSSDLKLLGKKLQNSTMVDPDMNHVLSLWKDVMTNGGEWPFNLEPTSTDGFNIQFPERVAVMTEPAPEADSESESKIRPKKMIYPASEAIANGKMLLLKSAELKGGVSAAARAFEIDISLGRKLVRAYRKFGDVKHLAVVSAAGNASKLFELLHIADTDVEKLILGLDVNGVTLKELGDMSVWEIRKWLGLKVSRATSVGEAEELQKFRESQPKQAATRKRDRLVTA